MTAGLPDLLSRPPDRSPEAVAGAPETFQTADAALLQDPYPRYSTLREQAPVLRRPGGEVVVTRYEDVFRVLTAPEFGTSKLRPSVRQDQEGRQLGEALWLLDPPEHTQLRRALAGVLTPRMAKATGFVEGLTMELLDTVRFAGPVEFLETLAQPLATRTTAALLGVPRADVAELTGWADQVALMSDVDLPPPKRLQSLIASRRCIGYFEELVADKERNPADDAISDMLDLASQGMLDRNLIAYDLMMLLVAAQETTRNLLGNGMYALSLHCPEPAEVIEAGSHGSVKTAVEELLRFDSPTQCVFRTAKSEVSLGDQTISRGDTIFAVLGSANHDERVFDSPEQLDLRRSPNRHLAFAHGGHVCLGAGLARTEGQAMVRALAEAYVRIELNEKPLYRSHYVFRGLRALNVSLT